MNTAREELRALVDEKCLTVGHSYTLTTGRQSGFYFDCKKAMLDGKCLGLIADAFLEEAGKLPRFPDAIGGLTMGADFIVAAVIQRAFETGNPWYRAPSFAKNKRNTEPETRSRTSFRKAHRSWSSTTSSQPVHRPRLPATHSLRPDTTWSESWPSWTESPAAARHWRRSTGARFVRYSGSVISLASIRR